MDAVIVPHSELSPTACVVVAPGFAVSMVFGI